MAIPPKYRNAIIGIDVSRHQKVIDWSRVSEGEKVKFAYLKSTEGMTLVDKSYDNNYESCRKAGLICGSYHFLNPYRNGKLQARHFLKNSEFRHGDLLPVLDIERKHFLGNKFLHRVIDDFISEIKRQTGSDVILYCSYNFYRRHLHPRYKFRKLWMAHYNTTDLSAVHQSWSLWQYTEKGRVGGITGRVDINVYKGETLDGISIKKERD